MGWFSKTIDPIEKRAKDLEREMAELESELRQAAEDEPSFRSTAYPDEGGEKELILEEYDQSQLTEPPSEIQEELDSVTSKPTGFREKFKRLKKEVGATPVSNPKLVKLLSTGNIRGLEPLRYERRVARNRFFFMLCLLLLVLTGLAMVLHRNY
ncbi:MAG: hypothetical protein ACPGVU_00760 [Limisphaerales bacterium]